MSLKHIFGGLVIGIASLFLIMFAMVGSYLLAVLAFGLGAAWLVADSKIESYQGTFFFLVFVVLAMIAGLNSSLTPLALFGMCANLAAWDLARFRVRLADEKMHDRRAALEERHLRLLAVITCTGFLLALPPLFFRLAFPFFVVWGGALLTLLALMRSMRSFSKQRD